MDQRKTQARRALLQNDFESAARLLEQYIETCTGDDAARLDLAVCHLTLKKPALALRLASMKITGAESSRASLVRAKALRALHRMDAAASELRLTLGVKQLPVDLRLNAATELSDLYLNMFGDPEGAAAVLGNSRHPSLKERAAESRLMADLYMGTRDATQLSRLFTHHAQTYLDLRGQRASLRTQGRRSATSRSRPRIGVISPSLGATPVGFLTLGALHVLAERVELLYFDRSQGYRDWLAQGFRESSADWIRCRSLPPRDLAQRIRERDLDALIDCGGWTDMDALRALSLRPAPRQFKWVGGQALTSGLDCFDGFLTDRWQVPRASESLYREPILRFDGSYVTYLPPPYFRLGKSARPKPGVYALVSNPAKISESTLRYIKRLAPKRLLLIDHRWRYQNTRDRLLSRLRELAPTVDFIVPNGHAEYLETLRDAPATFIDTRPYSMGLTAIELILMGKTISGVKPRATGLMCERHSFGHRQTSDFAGYAAQAAQLYQWCTR